MASLRYTRNVFLRGLCIVYLSAFLSFYFQIPGLYGDNGVLPAKAVLENSKHKTLFAKIHYQPTLLWLAPYLGLDTSYALDVLALLGAFLAFTGLVSQKFCIIPVFSALWSLYFSIYQVGQVFVQNSYDEFLLEAGFLAIFVAPFLPGRRKGSKGTSTDLIGFWLVQWLLFRFLFTTGVTKLISGCPKWWSLTALQYHFETMPLPSPLAWYAHQMDPWCLKATTVFVNYCELILPFLFFVPLRFFRLAAFISELFLQICVVLTGNFEFSNLLMVTLLLSLLDDYFFYGRRKVSTTWRLLEQVLCAALYVCVIYGLILLYDIKFTEGVLDATITFTRSQFDAFLSWGLHYTIHLGFVSLTATFCYCLSQVWIDGSSMVFGTISTVFYAVVAGALFYASTVPLASLHPATNSTVHPTVRTVYNRLHKIHAVNQYGLFGKMPGDDGRPEIILEGADSQEGPWKEYNFLYKPGNVNHSMPFVAPYAPKLDWQMYWAAYSTYDKQPWLLSLTHRLLIGRPEVLNLLDRLHSPYANKPPKYIRALLYKYKYTTAKQRSSSSWWVREKVGEYFPPYSKDSPFLVDYLKARNLYPTVTKLEVNPVWRQILDSIRYVCNHFEATLLFWSIFTSGLAIIVTSSPSRRN